MNKVLVKVYMPSMNKQYNVWLPLNKKIYNITLLLMKGANELDELDFDKKDMPSLYNKLTGTHYNVNLKLKDTDIRNGAELILI